MNFIKCVSVILFMGIATVVIANPVNASPEQCADYNILSSDQRKVLREAYYAGKPMNYGWTFAAIALNESSAGKYRLNYNSHDFGLMQINIETASRTLGVTNHYKKMELAHRLIHDDDLNYELAAEVLEHFRAGRTITNQVYVEMLKSYNEGYTWRTDPESALKAHGYYTRVANTVNMLRNCATWQP